MQDYAVGWTYAKLTCMIYCASHKGHPDMSSHSLCLQVHDVTNSRADFGSLRRERKEPVIWPTLFAVFLCRYLDLTNPKLTLMVGDIRDKEQCYLAMEDVSYVFHLAGVNVSSRA